MKTLKISMLLLCTSMLIVLVSSAQNIIINEDLNANSEPLKVKIGAEVFGKMGKWRFGEYSLVSGKKGWEKTSSKSNFFNTKSESKSSQKFSFVMCNKQADSAFVNAVKNLEIKEDVAFELFSGFFIGDDEVKVNARNFTASITTNKDTAETWLLLMNSEWGSESANSGDAFLSNGIKKYSIFLASSNSNGTDKRDFPAEGYEFRDENHAVMALQYFGGGVFGLNKNIVWIDNRQDPKMKLVFAAAATAIFQLKMGDMGL